MPPRRFTPSQAPWTITILLAITLLAAGHAASQTTGHDLEITTDQEAYQGHEDVQITVTNNDTTPTQGTPTIEIRHCTLGEQLCDAEHETVDAWTGNPRTLDPQESFHVPWDQRTPEGEPAPEGTYTAHLTWETQQGETTATSPPFTLEGPTQQANAPTIHAHEPQQGATLTTTMTDVHVDIHAQSPLQHVHARIDETTIVDEKDPGSDAYTIEDTLELDPGTHVLTVHAKDDQDRSNRTAIPFTIAPDERVTAGSVGFRVHDDGSLEDVRIDGVLLFENVEATTPSPQLTADASQLGLALHTTNGATLAFTLADGWQATERPAGLELDHPDVGTDVALMTSTAAQPQESEGVLLADVRAGESVIVRPGTGSAIDEPVLEAILDGDVGAEVLDREEATTVFRYGGYNVTASSGQDRLVAILDATREEGASFVFHLSADAYPSAQASLDGERLPATDDPSTALDPAGSSHVLVDEGQDATTVIVGVDSFSTRDVIVQAVEDAGAFLTVGTVVAAAVVVGLAGWGLFRRPSP